MAQERVAGTRPLVRGEHAPAPVPHQRAHFRAQRQRRRRDLAEWQRADFRRRRTREDVRLVARGGRWRVEG